MFGGESIYRSRIVRNGASMFGYPDPADNGNVVGQTIVNNTYETINNYTTTSTGGFGDGSSDTYTSSFLNTVFEFVQSWGMKLKAILGNVYLIIINAGNPLNHSISIFPAYDNTFSYNNQFQFLTTNVNNDSTTTIQYDSRIVAYGRTGSTTNGTGRLLFDASHSETSGEFLVGENLTVAGNSACTSMMVGNTDTNLTFTPQYLYFAESFKEVYELDSLINFIHRNDQAFGGRTFGDSPVNIGDVPLATNCLFPHSTNNIMIGETIVNLPNGDNISGFLSIGGAIPTFIHDPDPYRAYYTYPTNTLEVNLNSYFNQNVVLPNDVDDLCGHAGHYLMTNSIRGHPGHVLRLGSGGGSGGGDSIEFKAEVKFSLKVDFFVNVNFFGGVVIIPVPGSTNSFSGNIETNSIMAPKPVIFRGDSAVDYTDQYIDIGRWDFEHKVGDNIANRYRGDTIHLNGYLTEINSYNLYINTNTEFKGGGYTYDFQGGSFVKLSGTTNVDSGAILNIGNLGQMNILSGGVVIFDTGSSVTFNIPVTLSNSLTVPDISAASLTVTDIYKMNPTGKITLHGDTEITGTANIQGDVIVSTGQTLASGNIRTDFITSAFTDTIQLGSVDNSAIKINIVSPTTFQGDTKVFGTANFQGDVIVNSGSTLASGNIRTDFITSAFTDTIQLGSVDNTTIKIKMVSPTTFTSGLKVDSITANTSGHMISMGNTAMSYLQVDQINNLTGSTLYIGEFGSSTKSVTFFNKVTFNRECLFQTLKSNNIITYSINSGTAGSLFGVSGDLSIGNGSNTTTMNCNTVMSMPTVMNNTLTVPSINTNPYSGDLEFGNVNNSVTFEFGNTYIPNTLNISNIYALTVDGVRFNNTTFFLDTIYATNITQNDESGIILNSLSTFMNDVRILDHELVVSQLNTTSTDLTFGHVDNSVMFNFGTTNIPNTLNVSTIHQIDDTGITFQSDIHIPDHELQVSQLNTTSTDLSFGNVDNSVTFGFGNSYIPNNLYVSNIQQVDDTGITFHNSTTTFQGDCVFSDTQVFNKRILQPLPPHTLGPPEDVYYMINDSSTIITHYLFVYFQYNIQNSGIYYVTMTERVDSHNSNPLYSMGILHYDTHHSIYSYTSLYSSGNYTVTLLNVGGSAPLSHYLRIQYSSSIITSFTTAHLSVTYFCFSEII